MYARLIEKCKEKKIAYEEVRQGLIIEIPEERRSRPIKITDKLIDIVNDEGNGFLEFRYVPGYNAIWSESKKIIECEVDCRYIFRHFKNKYFPENNDELTFKVGNYEIILSKASLEFSFLDATAGDIYFPMANPAKIRTNQDYIVTVKLKVDNLKTTKDAVKLVETVIESFCFEVSCKFDLVFSPSMPRKRVRGSGKDGKDLNLLNINKKFDKNALAYYWNAEAAIQFPLIQFLGYYQVVEYFYSFYSNKDLHSKIGLILKDPDFSLHNHKYINKIIEENRKFFNNNKDQVKLEITINNCLLEGDFREWYESDYIGGGEISKEGLSRKQYFSGSKCNNISEININSKSDSELLKQSISRFYDIRCRIVHTDSNIDDKDLNPRTHYDNFIHDIELAKFFARKVLLATSTEF